MQDAIVLEEGTNIIVDGMHRYRFLCKKHPDGNVMVRVRFMIFADRTAAMRWMIRNQFGRRNVSDYHRTRLALQLKPAIAEQAEQNQKAGVRLNSDAGQQPVNTLQQVADLAKVSRDTVNKVETIQKQGTAELQEALRKDKISINVGAKAAKLTPDRQKQVVEAAKQSKSTAVSVARELQPQPRNETRLTRANVEALVTEVHSRIDELATHYHGGSLAAIHEMPRQREQLTQALQQLQQLVGELDGNRSIPRSPAGRKAAKGQAPALPCAAPA